MAKEQVTTQSTEPEGEQTADPREQMLQSLRDEESASDEGQATEGQPQQTETPPESGEQTDDQAGQVAPEGQPEGQPEGEGEGEAPPKSVEEQLAEALRELGWQGEDPSEAPNVMLDAFKRQATEYQQMQQQLAEQQELARYGTQYLREQREREEAARQPQGGQPAGEEAKQPDPWWNPPKFDPTTIEQYRDVGIGDDGQPQVTWKKNTPPEVIENAEAYQRYLDQWATNLVQRPQEVLPQIIEQEFDRLFEERISQRESVANIESFAEQVKETNRDWMYTTDTQGQEVLTPEGQQMTQLLSEVAEAGISDPRTQWEYAVARFDYMNRQKDQQTQNSSRQASDTAAEKRKKHVDKGSNRQPQNRTGTVPKPEESNNLPQNPNLSPGQQLIEMMRQRGEEMW